MVDLEKLRSLRKGDRLMIDGHAYTVTGVTGDAVAAGKDYVSVFQFWMRRDDDQKDFMLHVPQEEDREDMIVLHRVVHSHLGSVMNVPIRFRKFELA